MLGFIEKLSRLPLFNDQFLIVGIETQLKYIDLGNPLSDLEVICATMLHRDGIRMPVENEHVDWESLIPRYDINANDRAIMEKQQGQLLREDILLHHFLHDK